MTISAAKVVDSILVIETELADCSLEQRWQECSEQGLAGIPAKELMVYLSGIADAIDYLHRQDILHGDIKPANILLKGGKPLLGDFGLMQVLTEPVGLLDRWATPEFAAPEVRKGNLAAQTDQYALAVSYYLLRFGRLPYNLVGKSPDYSSLDLSQLPFSQRLLVNTALEQQPEKRWPDCSGFIEDLGMIVSLTELEPSNRSIRRIYSSGQMLVLGTAMLLALLRLLPTLLVFGCKLLLEMLLAWVLTLGAYLAFLVVANGVAQQSLTDHLQDAADRFGDYNTILSLNGFMIGAIFLKGFCRKAYPYVLWPIGMAALLGASWLYSGNDSFGRLAGDWVIGLAFAAIYFGVDWLLGKWGRKPWHRMVLYDA